jgi:hypothetical protein
MCFLKLWKLNYNERNKQCKSLIPLLARAYKLSHVLCQLNSAILLNDLFKKYVYLHFPRGLFLTRFPNYSLAAVFISIYALHNLSVY